MKSRRSKQGIGGSAMMDCLQFPELVDRLGRMYSLMENRVGQLQTFTRLQGRLELMLSQIARQKDDEGATASAALLTLQDGKDNPLPQI